MNRFREVFISYCFVAFSVCVCKAQSPDQVVKEFFPSFYKEGHRGTRGLMPENTIRSMKKAIDDGANVIELDIQISKDRQVLVAHDPFINSKFTRLHDGKEIPASDEKKYILYQMDYAGIRKFDVGSKYYDAYPKQKKISTYIPLLGELIDSVEQYTTSKQLPGIIYNIEIKSKPDQDGYYQPKPDVLIRMVMDVVNSKQIKNRFYIQSFDIRQIQEVHKNYPNVVTGFLTSDKEFSFERNIEMIGFNPQIYSPNYKLVTSALIRKCHDLGIKFVPWTVNTSEEIKMLVEMGVDGIITDYPHLLKD